jgi:hypothetical protein
VFRIYTVSAGEGKVFWMYPAGAASEHDGSIFPNARDAQGNRIYPGMTGQEAFTQFCHDLAYNLFSAKPHHYPNVLLSFFDTVDPSPQPDTLWYQTFDMLVGRIRQAEQEIGSAPHIVINHFKSAEDLQWVANYIGGGYRTDNVLFSGHIYRYHNTFDLFGPRPDASVTYEYIRSYIGDGDKLAYKYIMDTYNVPVLATTIGAFRGQRTNADGEAEYQTFVKSLQALNEFKIGYCAYCWPQDNDDPPAFAMSTSTTSRSPAYANRVGQALIDAIAEN